MIKSIVFLHGVLFCMLNANALPLDQIPKSLKSEPHQRDSYNWNDRHQSILKHHQTVKPEYVFIGDSLTHRWGGSVEADTMPISGFEPLKRLMGKHKFTNMGFGFDYIDNAFYRVDKGELDECSPRVIILLLGTNNIGHRQDSAQVCGDNMKAFVALLKEKCPKSKILVLGVLPRKEPVFVQTIKDTNQMYNNLADNSTVFFFDVGKKLLEKDSDFPQDKYMLDTVHISPLAYELIANELILALKKIDSQYIQTSKS